jgi:hypothetical protein
VRAQRNEGNTRTVWVGWLASGQRSPRGRLPGLPPSTPRPPRRTPCARPAREEPAASREPQDSGCCESPTNSGSCCAEPLSDSDPVGAPRLHIGCQVLMDTVHFLLNERLCRWRRRAHPTSSASSGCVRLSRSSLVPPMCGYPRPCVRGSGSLRAAAFCLVRVSLCPPPARSLLCPSKLVCATASNRIAVMGNLVYLRSVAMGVLPRPSRCLSLTVSSLPPPRS